MSVEELCKEIWLKLPKREVMILETSPESDKRLIDIIPRCKIPEDVVPLLVELKKHVENKEMLEESLRDSEITEDLCRFISKVVSEHYKEIMIV